jgi:hypothetical protein
MDFELPAIYHATRLMARLAERKIDCVIIGGVAALIHGSTVITNDVDVCLRFNRENLMALHAALADLRPVHRITPQRLPFEITEANWSMLKNVYLDTDWGKLDCLGEVLGLGCYDEVVAASEISRAPFGDVRVLTLDGIIKAKEAVARPHDLQAAKQLRCIQAKKRRGT